MRERGGSADVRVAQIAARHHGVVTIRQLADAGLDHDAVGRRVRKGLLHRVHRGVYRVGHRAPSLEAHYLAAVLACGEGAVLSGLAAANLYGLTRGTVPPPEVTVARHVRRARRVRHLDARDVSTYRRIPVTTVPRTLIDLAVALELDDLARTCHEADVRHRVGANAVLAALARRPNAPGAARLREVYGGGLRITLSKLERAFLTQLRAAGLELPETNRSVDGRYVDCRWPARGLTVELDGYRYHHTRHAWELDRRREREARARGDEFRRYTWGDVTEDRTMMLAELRRLVGSG